MKNIRISLAAALILTLSGCSWFEGYRPPVQQGSVVDSQALTQLKLGMSKAQVRFIMGGVEVSERTLAREAIHRAKPGGGFLADNHTLDNWKWAQWRPDIIDRMRYDRWVKKGSKGMTSVTYQGCTVVVSSR